jgi:hypothetical protein
MIVWRKRVLSSSEFLEQEGLEEFKAVFLRHPWRMTTEHLEGGLFAARLVKLVDQVRDSLAYWCGSVVVRKRCLRWIVTHGSRKECGHVPRSCVLSLAARRDRTVAGRRAVGGELAGVGGVEPAIMPAPKSFFVYPFVPVEFIVEGSGSSG